MILPRSFLPWTAVALAITGGFGCAPGTGGFPDGGGDAGIDAGWTVAPPVLTPCPEGWRERQAETPDGVATCDPWPEGGPVTCAADEAHFPGDPGCTRIGTACPAGEWPDDLPADRPILYVRAGGGPGGDGTQAAPFGTIAEAMVTPSPDTIVALGKGTFDEAVVLPTGVTLWGACVAQTVVASSSPTQWAGTLMVAGTDTAVNNLQVGGDRYGVRVEGADVTVDLRNVLIARAEGMGLLVLDGASVTLRTVVVRGTRPRRSDGGLGRGIELQSGAQVTGARVVIEANLELGVVTWDPATLLSLTDVAIRDTEGRAVDGRLGRGLLVQAGSAVELTRVVIERNREVGVLAWEPGTRLTLVDVVVRDTRARASDGAMGHGLQVNDGARAEVTRGLFARNRTASIVAAEVGTRLTLTDVVIRDTRGRESDSRMGRGLQVQTGAAAEAVRLSLERNLDVGIFASGAQTTVVLADVAIMETREQACAVSTCLGFGAGMGIASATGAAVELTRFLISRSALAGAQLVRDGEMDLHQGEVSSNPVGVNVQTEGFDVNRLLDRVRYQNNGVNLDASALPVPDPFLPIGG